MDSQARLPAKGEPMTRTQELLARADHYADRAARARGRTARNTYLSLEQSYRNLVAQYERFDAAGISLAPPSPPHLTAVGA
jgi:hypothetical protein